MTGLAPMEGAVGGAGSVEVADAERNAIRRLSPPLSQSKTKGGEVARSALGVRLRDLT